MINLNPGGFLGALLPIAAGVIVVLMGSGTNGEAARLLGRSVIAAVVVGAYVGNFLWGRFVAKPKPDEPRDLQVMS